METTRMASTRGLAAGAGLAVIAVIVTLIAMQGREYREVTEREAAERIAAYERAQEASRPAMQPVRATPAVPPSIAELVEFTGRDAPPELPAGHDYTAEGLQRLATALGDIVEDPALARRVQALEAAAGRLQEDPDSLEHAGIARAAFGDATEILADVQKRRYPRAIALEDRVSELRRAAEALDEARPMGQQRDEVEAFFRAAGGSVEAIARRS